MMWDMNTVIQLLEPAKQSIALPAICVYTPDLKAALAFYVHQLGFIVQRKVPHVVALISLGSFTLMLQEVGAKPARFERAQRSIDSQSFQPKRYVVYAEDLAVIAQQLLPKLKRITPESSSLLWQESQVWELSFQDNDHNTLCFSERVGSKHSMFF